MDAAKKRCNLVFLWEAEQNLPLHTVLVFL